MFKTIRTNFLAIVLAGITFIAVSPQAIAASPADSVEAAIKQPILNYAQAANSSDLDGVINLYTNDAVFMAQNSMPAVGKEAVRNAYRGLFEAIKLDIAFQFDEVRQISEDWAYVRTRSTGTLKLLVGSKATLPESNQELFLLHRESDGQWRITHYIFATNLPAQ